MTTIAAFDPSLTGFGIVISENWTVTATSLIRAKSDSDAPKIQDTTERVTHIAGQLTSVMNVFDPDLVLSEYPMGYASLRASKAAGLLISIITIKADQTGIDVEWITPKKMKKRAGTSTSADKQEVIQRARKEFSQLDNLMNNLDYKYEKENIGEAGAVLLAGKRSDDLLKEVSNG